MPAKKIFLDSNIFLNFLLKEDEFFEGSKKIFENVEEGRLIGITTLINLMEILAVLRKKSDKSDEEIIGDIEKLGEIQNLFVTIPNEIQIAEGFEIQKQMKTFPVDSILISIAKDLAEAFVTRDKELQKKAILYIPTLEPEKINNGD